MTWLLPNISTFYICLYSAKKVVPRVTCQHCRKLRSCVVFRTPRVGYGRSFVRSISLAIITFSAIKHDHILWQLCFFHCGLFLPHCLCNLEVVAPFNAAVTACHKWKTKTTIFFNKNKKHPEHKTSTTCALLN